MLKQYASNGSAMRAWTDMVGGHLRQFHESGQNSGDYRRLNASSLHTDGFTIVP